MLIVDSPLKTVIIPKTRSDNYDYYLLILRHDATGEIFTFNLGNDSPDKNYFKFTLDMTSKPHGEYTYFITGNNPEWSINIDAINIYESCYYSNIVYLGAVDELIFIENEFDFAITADNDGECVPLDFLQTCLLQYFSFENHTHNTCYTYKQYECCE